MTRFIAHTYNQHIGYKYSMVEKAIKCNATKEGHWTIHMCTSNY